jgi:hypothetical protein
MARTQRPRPHWIPVDDGTPEKANLVLERIEQLSRETKESLEAKQRLEPVKVRFG